MTKPKKKPTRAQIVKEAKRLSELWRKYADPDLIYPGEEYEFDKDSGVDRRKGWNAVAREFLR